MKEVTGYLVKYNEQGYKVPTEMAEGEDQDLGLKACNNERSKSLLGMQYIELSKTVCDMVDTLIASGKLKPPA